MFCAPGNAGTATLGTNLAIPSSDTEAIYLACVSHRIDLVVIGPEDPLAAGMVNILQSRGVQVFGPSQEAAQLESSKWFAKSVMQAANVPHARGARFDDPQEAHAYLDLDHNFPPVVKADGLAAGKGVFVSDNIDEAHDAVDKLMSGQFGHSAKTLVIEENLIGREASAMAFTDGSVVLQMPLACDYKRALDGDLGPNTGGMGVYSPPGFIHANAMSDISSTIHQPVINIMAKNGNPFKGILYAGLMINDKKTNVLEFNCRFGDPETQVTLPQLNTDLLSILKSCIDGRLGQQRIEWRKGAVVGVVLASGGYPNKYKVGFEISGLSDVDNDVLVFHAGTKIDKNGKIITNGGRVLTVVAQAQTLVKAREKAYKNAVRIHFEGNHFRTDIALREIT